MSTRFRSFCLSALLAALSPTMIAASVGSAAAGDDIVRRATGPAASVTGGGRESAARTLPRASERPRSGAGVRTSGRAIGSERRVEAERGGFGWGNGWDRRVIKGRAIGYGEAGRGWRDLDKPRARYDRHGSFLFQGGRHDRYDDADLFEDLAALQLGLSAPAERLPAYPSGAKIIDIETERLDRRPLAPGEMEVIHTGAAKIIRLARRDGRPSRRHVADAPSRRPLGADYLQPWSAGWLKYCTEAHIDFDPGLGTYVAEDGRVRFCEGR